MSDPVSPAGGAPRVVPLEPGTPLPPAAPTAPRPEFRELLRPAGPEPGTESGPQLLREAALRIARGEQRLDRVMREAARGRTLTNEELIALQATVYRHTQEVELAAKLVDRLAGAVRQTLTSQQ